MRRARRRDRDLLRRRGRSSGRCRCGAADRGRHGPGGHDDRGRPGVRGLLLRRVRARGRRPLVELVWSEPSRRVRPQPLRAHRGVRDRGDLDACSGRRHSDGRGGLDIGDRRRSGARVVGRQWTTRGAPRPVRLPRARDEGADRRGRARGEGACGVRRGGCRALHAAHQRPVGDGRAHRRAAHPRSATVAPRPVHRSARPLGDVRRRRAGRPRGRRRSMQPSVPTRSCRRSCRSARRCRTAVDASCHTDHVTPDW